MKNVFTWIGVALVVAGAVIGALAGFPQSDLIAVALAAVGFATEVVAFISKTEKKDWRMWLTIIGIAAGSFLMVIAGFTGDTVKVIITAVVGLVVMLASILPSLIKKRN